MLIAFDLDGVLAEANIPVFRLADMIEQTSEIYKWAFKCAKPLLNPASFMADEDEFIVITGRPKEYKEITYKWINRYHPNCKGIKIVDMALLKGATGQEVFNWLNETAKRKAKIINDLDVAIYFDDSAYAVRKLRELCPNCRIINYGGRV